MGHPDYEPSDFDRIHSVKQISAERQEMYGDCDNCGHSELVKAKVTFRTIIACPECESTEEVLYAR